MSAPGGKVFISVPFGREQRHDWFQQFTSAMVASIVERFQGTAASIRYYSYTRAGWQISNSTDCERSQYFDFHLEGRKRNSDLAAAARAVACLELTK